MPPVTSLTCSRGLVLRNEIRLHEVGQRQGEHQVRDIRRKAKAPPASIQSNRLFFMRSISWAVRIPCGHRPVRQPGVQPREWKASRRG